jgi:hypothetical protein
LNYKIVSLKDPKSLSVAVAAGAKRSSEAPQTEHNKKLSSNNIPKSFKRTSTILEMPKVDFRKDAESLDKVEEVFSFGKHLIKTSPSA